MAKINKSTYSQKVDFYKKHWPLSAQGKHTGKAYKSTLSRLILYYKSVLRRLLTDHKSTCKYNKSTYKYNKSLWSNDLKSTFNRLLSAISRLV